MIWGPSEPHNHSTSTEPMDGEKGVLPSFDIGYFPVTSLRRELFKGEIYKTLHV